MRKLRTLIIEDNLDELEDLQKCLSKFVSMGKIEIAAKAKSYDKALEIFIKDESIRFDISILDYRLNDAKTILDLFEVVNDKNRFGIIAVATSFKAEVFDNLSNLYYPVSFSKPFEPENVDAPMFEIFRRHGQLENKLDKPIPIYDGSYKRLLHRDIFFIESIKKDEKTLFHCKDPHKPGNCKHFENNRPINSVLRELESEIFFKSHKGFIINLKYIDRCISEGHGARITFFDPSNGSKITFRDPLKGVVECTAPASRDGRKQLQTWGFLRAHKR
jgi:DNA-binding LytR/AlgR family response regulator